MLSLSSIRRLIFIGIHGILLMGPFKNHVAPPWGVQTPASPKKQSVQKNASLRGGVKNGPNKRHVIFEWPLSIFHTREYKNPGITRRNQSKVRFSQIIFSGKSF